jgi:hypothetical protein
MSVIPFPTKDKIWIRLISPMSGAKSWIEIHHICDEKNYMETLEGTEAVEILEQLSRTELLTLVEGYPVTLRGRYADGRILRAI